MADLGVCHVLESQTRTHTLERLVSQKKSGAKDRAVKKQMVDENPWPRRLTIGSAVAVVVFLVAVVALSSPPLRGVPDGTRTVAVGSPQHVDGEVYADGEVPAGGPHSQIWQNCGFYDAEIRPENALHSLEHGAVWITYQPDLPSDEVDKLRGFIRNPDKVLISPIVGQDSPIIVTAWASQLELDDASDGRLEQFVNEFEGASSAPEPGGRCNGGVGTPVG
jgi:hypothetical protein